MAIVKDLVILAVHGDIDRDSVQRVLDEKSAREPAKDLGGRQFDPNRGPFLNRPDWPEAECKGLVVATADPGGPRQDETRVEIAVFDFDQMTGLKTGGKLRLTLEPIE